MEIADHHATTLKMIEAGHILVSVEGEAERLQLEAIERLKTGPLAISAEELRRKRYALTDQLDDFIGATDPIELLYIGQQLVVETSELALLSKSQWLASGKWLPRYLAESDPELSIQLFKAIEAVITSGEKGPMEVVVLEILERIGGTFHL
ncbi:MAG: nucleotidyltransferase domain-containing protein [Actinobacteria bacterium]|nr:nucleotidyltransferase domain-containing protein [Actinomycetota bacterium]